MNLERDLSNKCKDGFVFEVLCNDIRLVMKAKGFVFFWMVEHDYCLRLRVLNAKSFKDEKLQANRTSFGQKERQISGFSPLGYGVIIGFN